MPAASHGYSLRSSGAVDAIASTTMPEHAHGDQNLFRGAHAQHAPARACSSGGTVSSPPVLSQHSFSGLSVPAMAQTFEPRVESTEDAPTCGARALATHEYASTLDGASFAMDRLGGATTVTELCSSSPISDVSSIGGLSSIEGAFASHDERESPRESAAQPRDGTRALAGAHPSGAPAHTPGGAPYAPPACLYGLPPVGSPAGASPTLSPRNASFLPPRDTRGGAAHTRSRARSCARTASRC